MDDVITGHSAIMHRYDPDNRIGLIVDEWGCWYNVEPGTNPGYLYQQNTMRDAIVAACNLNIFNRHSRRVVMANLAQAVNVLQALILTEGEALVKTPTYHVFDMFKEHQDGELVYCFQSPAETGDNIKIPLLSSSASVKDGVMTITLANCSLEEEAAVSCSLCGFHGTEASSRILTEEVHACNDFDMPERVVPKAFPVSLTDNMLSATLPPCCVVSVTIR